MDFDLLSYTKTIKTDQISTCNIKSIKLLE